MMASSDPRAQELFVRAAGYPPPERESLLRGSCAGDLRLEAEIRSLLAAHDRAGDFLLEPALGAAGAAAPAEIAGRYRLERVLASGTMGTVHLAHQFAPLERTVALKILRGGLASEEIVRRFERERRAIALMDHEHVARLYDAGSTEDGRHWFAMEYVPGSAITDYCRAQGLPLEARLALMVQVALAVHHAHQKGIIHRDLKPSNILVLERDGAPVPKVIDFGVAKCVLAHPDGALATRDGELIGTLDYMSPEQAGAARGAVDIRADIYALGVILYELIAGTLPLSIHEAGRSGLAEMLRVLREEEPPPPSARLRARQARGEPVDTPVSRVRGDLDSIVRTAMEKEPARRYASATELANDLARYLAREPVSVGPPGLRYRAARFLRRHRTLVAGAGIVAALLTVGLITNLLLYLEASEQRDAAISAEERTRRTLERTVANANQMLSLADEHLSRIAGATRARHLLAERALGEYERAAESPGRPPDLEHGLGYALQRMGECLQVMGESSRALAFHERSLELRSRYAAEAPTVANRRALGVGHWKVSEGLWLAGRLESAQEHNRQALAILAALQDEGAFDQGSAGVYLGIAHRRLADVNAITGDPERAVDGYRESLEWFDRGLAATPAHAQLHRGKALALIGLGETWNRLGRAGDALAALERAVHVIELQAQQARPADLWERTQEVRCRTAMADAEAMRSDPRAARLHGERAVAIATEVAEADRDNREALLHLGRALAMQGRVFLLEPDLPAARAALRRAIEHLEALASHDPQWAAPRIDLALACAAMANACMDLPPATDTGGLSIAPVLDPPSFARRAHALFRELDDAGLLPAAHLRSYENAPRE